MRAVRNFAAWSFAMTDIHLSHEKYLARHGVLKWMLRECVRANPFYVFSAAMLSYGVLQLNTEIDPQIGKLGGIILSLVLLHVYEFALLGAAAIVLHRRREEGGRDLHGLTIVAALFLGGSLLALDEFCALDRTIVSQTWIGPVLMLTALALAYFKLACYAKLPGVNLPASFRGVAIILLAGHSIAPVLGAYREQWALSTDAAQGLAWLAGWVSLVAVIWLVAKEKPDETARLSPEMNLSDDELPPKDPLQTRWAGTWLIVLTIGLSAMHLISADWVFDRSWNIARLLPALTLLGAVVTLMRWQRKQRIRFFAAALIGAPALASNWVWSVHGGSSESGVAATFANLGLQFLLAASVFYLSLAWTTRRWQFLIGLCGPLSTPALAALRSIRVMIPHFKALFTVVMGFVLLAGGVLLSLHRQKLLAWLERDRFARNDDVQ
jgi:hypothetical protein